MPSKVQVELEKEEAFTLLELLARCVYDGGALSADNAKEVEAIRSLCESLDNELVERFRDEYKRLAERRSKGSTNAP